MRSNIPLWSVFTDDLSCCYFTGSNLVERHHIFGGYNRGRSAHYGYVIPLIPQMHPNGVHYDRKHYPGMDLKLKQMAQKHYESHHGSRSDFIREFGKSWL